jgi:hypothetical protein
LRESDEGKNQPVVEKASHDVFYRRAQRECDAKRAMEIPS